MGSEGTERALTEKEATWVRSRASAARDLVAFLLSLPEPPTLKPTLLDRAFRAWRRMPPSEQVTQRDIVNCLGCAFGEFLASEVGAQWLVVSDSFGTDLAVREPSQGVVTYPLAIVAKRLNNPPEELAFFEPISASLKAFPFPTAGKTA
jgi:hypothetical protein